MQKNTLITLVLSLLAVFHIANAQESASETDSVIVSEAVATEVKQLTADCALPLSPTIPDGFLASKDELLSARKAIAAFQENLQEYRGCIDQVRLNFTDETEQKDQKLQAIKDLYNASVDAESATAELFNKSVRAFNERNVSQ